MYYYITLAIGPYYCTLFVFYSYSVVVHSHQSHLITITNSKIIKLLRNFLD